MQNTPESLQYAIDLQSECESDIDRNWRIDFVAMLAFNQNRFDLALSLLAGDDFLPANNIRLLAMAELNDWTGVCNLLRKIEINGPIDKRYRISTEVVSERKKKIQIQIPTLLHLMIPLIKWNNLFIVSENRYKIGCVKAKSFIVRSGNVL